MVIHVFAVTAYGKPLPGESERFEGANAVEVLRRMREASPFTTSLGDIDYQDRLISMAGTFTDRRIDDVPDGLNTEARALWLLRKLDWLGLARLEE